MGMKCFSLFTGVGGFEQGFPKDWQSVGFSEIDKYASQVLKYHFPKVKNYGDCTKINYEKVSDFDILTGGSPCQDFSIAGKRRGLKGSRSSLAWEFIRCLRDKKPRYFIWENVKGVMSSRGGWDFANLLIAFSESGYALWWQVLNAKDFGVPQNRERIFVIGFRNGSPKEVFFDSEPSQEIGRSDERNERAAIYFDDSIPNATTRRGRVMREAGTLMGTPRGGIIQLNSPRHSNDRLYGTGGVAPTLNTMQGGNRQPKIIAHYGHKNKLAVKMDISPTLKANSHGHEPMTLISSTQKHATIMEDMSSTLPSAMGLGGGHVLMISKTIRVGGQKSPHGSKQNWDSYEIEGNVRRLMLIECERLMGWADEWTKFGTDEKGDKVEISDSQRYKMCGNGVVSNVVKEIINNLIL